MKDLAIRTFGENDKIVLLAGMAFVLAAAAVVAVDNAESITCASL
ncbi:hypothetical protein F4560_001103 [Saccharothrix ecbatanensis]|uniref:Uncharacterized protein n=1 Tax=Saccharothrix ecbatanensis TaxID=1105145 RepID=A0A7W9HFL0_9PSEU|nr:hypothetical protein [Saccharothrix ecbatanensis]MBB5801335.1 hypothetical protein [Saccharothrix ecbatanensis]